MNFFQHQDKARRKTWLLVTLLLCSVACLIAVTIISVGFILYFLQSHTSSIDAVNSQQTQISQHFFYLIQSPFTLWIAFAVVCVVGLGSLYKLIQLNRGGHIVAESLGGRRIASDSDNHMERKVLNVVEEMAIASGNPVPPVYLLDEGGINAFAAGLSRRDAVIGVTRACIEQLTRDQLQGVIAHEFSHIHNGDMRLNLRLVAILHGILLIGLIGQYILRGSGHSRYALSRRNKNQGKQALLGLVLVTIGYGGTFFGKLIKSAVSRQREFLADASAVQFTRNPPGISGALKKIGGFSSTSLISSANATEYSHMFFGEGLGRSAAQLTATHPPLSERILRIEPNWKGQFTQTTHTISNEHSSDNTEDTHSQFSTTAPSPSETPHIGAEPTQQNLSTAKEIISDLPTPLVFASREPFSARSVVYGLLLDKNRDIRQSQLETLRSSAHPASFKTLLKLSDAILALPAPCRLPLLNLCIPALKQLSNAQYQVFKKSLTLLIKADKRTTLFEWCLFRITVKNIEITESKGLVSLKKLEKEACYLLWITSVAGKNANYTSAYEKGLALLDIDKSKKPVVNTLSLKAMDTALDQLERLKPLDKPRLLKALLAVITADNTITDDENQLFRAIADSLDCPIPPIPKLA